MKKIILTMFLLMFLSFSSYAKDFKYVKGCEASYDIQKLTYDICEESGRDYLFTLAIIQLNPSLRSYCIKSKTHDYGLMQINKSNHNELKKELGLTDIMDPSQNIQAGQYYIYDYINKYGSLSCALMAYNMGESNAKKLWKKGVYETNYSKAILSIYNAYQNEYAETV